MRILFGLILMCWANGVWAEKPKVTSMTWGGLKFPNSLSPTDANNLGFDTTYLAQLDLGWKIGKGRLVPFITLFSQADSERFIYNGKQKIGLGIALKYKVRRHSNLSFAIKYETDYRYLTTEFADGVVVSVDYGHYRKWPKKQNREVIFSIWANGKYPGSVSPSDRDNLILQGQARLARVSPIGNSKYKWAPVGTLGLFWDTQEHAFNNKVQLDFGLELKRKIAKMDLTLWAKYRFDRRYVSDVSYAGPMIGLSFFKRFDGSEKPKGKKPKGWLGKVLRRQKVK